MRRRLAVAFGASLLAVGLTVADSIAPEPVAADPPQVGDSATFPTYADRPNSSTSVVEPITGPDGLMWGRSDNNSLVSVQAGEIFRSRADLTGRDAGRWMTLAHGDVWLSGNENIHRITSAGAITSYPVSGLGSGDVTTGADGNVWAVAQAGARVVRLTATGDTSVSHSIPGGGGGQLTAGPDGVLWIIANGQLVRMSLDGTTETSAAGVATPARIVSGADGYLWVAGRNGGVARVTPGGVATTVATPSTETIGFEAAVGGGAHLLTATSVISVAPDGTTSSRSLVGLGLVRPEGLWSSPDGAVWVPGTGGFWANQVLVLQPDGTTSRIMAGVQYPHGAGLGPDGRVWISAFIGASIGRVDADGSVEAFSLPVGHGLSDMVADDVGNMWFSNGQIVRRAPDGSHTTFETPGMSPWDLAWGPDGNLWIAGLFDDVIGRLTPGGTFTTFPVPGVVEPSRIEVGPDANLWIMSSADATVGRLTPAGALTVFSIDGVEAIADLTAGPDGNLWMTAASDVVRMGVDGEQTVFPTGVAARAITAGPDGNLWAAGRDEVVRVTPSGGVTRFSAPGAVAWFHVVATDDGYVWVPNRQTSTITRITGAAASVQATIEESSVLAGEMAHAHVTVTNDGPTTLTGVTLSGLCAQQMEDLAPGASTTVDCTPTVASPDDLVATLASDQTQPEDSAPVELEIRTGILGTVTDDQSDEPLPGTWVIALDHSLQPAAATTVQEDGTFELTVPAGSYRLETWTPDGTHAFEWYASTQPPADFDDLIPVEVAADAPADVEIDLTRLGPPAPVSDPGSIVGTVVERDSGRPIAGAWVTVVRGGIPIRGVATDEAGHYRFDGLARAPHILVALDLPAHHHEFFEGQATPGDPLTLVTPSETTRADFHLASR